MLQPLLFLLAFGVGFGSLVDGTGRVAEATGGPDYLVWLAPALLAVSAVQSATFESTYPVLSGFKWQRVYHAMTAGPISPAQVALAHLTWISAKLGRIRADLHRGDRGVRRDARPGHRGVAAGRGAHRRRGGRPGHRLRRHAGRPRGARSACCSGWC